MLPVLLVNPGHEIDELRSKIEALLTSSVNAAEFMGKYRNKGIKEEVTEIKVKWAADGRDSRLFPRETILTEDNAEAVLRMMAIGVGKDVFDVKVKATGGEDKDKNKNKK
jgi:hypothetical protein